MIKNKRMIGYILIALGSVIAAYGGFLVNESNSNSTNDKLDLILKFQRESSQNEEVFQSLVQEKFGLNEEELQEYLNDVIVKSKDNLEIAKAYMLKNDYDKASKSLQKALEFTPQKEKKAWIYSNLGLCYANMLGEENTAEKFLKKAYDYYIQFVDGGSEDKRYQLGHIVNELAVERKKKESWVEARKYYEEAISIRKKLADENPKKYLFDLGESYNNLGILLAKMKTERFDIPNSSVDNIYQEALTAQNNSLQNDENNKHKLNNLISYALTLNNVANWYSNNEEFDPAEIKNLESLKIYEMADERNPRLYKPYLALAQGNRANLFYSRFYHTGKGNITEIKAMFEKSIGTYEKINLSNNPKNIKMFIGTLNMYKVVYAYEKDDKKIDELNIKINDLKLKLK